MQLGGELSSRSRRQRLLESTEGGLGEVQRWLLDGVSWWVVVDKRLVVSREGVLGEEQWWALDGGCWWVVADKRLVESWEGCLGEAV